MSETSNNANLKATVEPLLRRKYPRRGLRRKIGILVDGRYWIGAGLEVGEGGASFLFARPLPEGKKIVMSFQIPGGAFISVQAEIKNNKKDHRSSLFHFGVNFLNLKFEHKRDVRSYVSARTESERDLDQSRQN